MCYSIGVLGFKIGVTVLEVNVQYRFLAQRIHPDKHNIEVTVMMSEKAVDLFKLANNAQ